MQESEVYAYQWHSDDSENKTVIHMFGIDSDNKNVYVRIEGFTPYIYLEIPEDIDWKLDYNVKNLYDKIDEVCSKYGSRNKPISRQLKYKKKLYYANKIQEGKNLIDKKFPFVCLVFNTKKSISFVRKELDKGFHMSIIRDSKKILQRVNVKVHESNATPVLQLTCFQKISPTGWLRVKGHRVVKSCDKESYCDVEYIAKWTDIKPVKTPKENIPHPLIMSFDIEVNSKNVNAMPSASIPEDKVFQISCLFLRQSEDINKNCEKYLLTLGNPDPKKVGEDVIIRKYPTESCLLEGYSELICEKNPNVIIGYNIFQFDIPYLIDRSQFNFCQRKFNQQSFLIGKEGTCRKISWSSSAYKNQDFTFLDSEGRLFIDLLPIVKRDYIFDTYSLKNVSANFLGQTKDPLTPKGIFKCYRMFTPQSLGVVGKYVVQDSMLVLRLFEKLQVWIGLTEMSKICNTPMLSLFTQGQQVKIFSQIYKICIDSNYVVEQDGYICGDGDNYTGAYVFDPVPGLYDMVVSFDFSSLYPSIIIAYNIDYTTLVRDPSIPDELCHIFEWEDHIGCKHETKKRKTKPKNIVCGSHKFRFLKEPKGIMPALLENLLKSRKDINSDIKTLKLQLSEEKEEEAKSELQTKITVLDKRQLAMKISANSMYGGFGVKKGYLPFMPGAMCTTAKGRESIEKAAKHLQQNYSANLIYGDSVTGDTPILVQYEDGSVDIVRIDEIGEVWDQYEGFKVQDSNRIEKQQTIPYVSSGCYRVMNIVKVWTGEEWSMVKRVIRHKTQKKMYRILTHTGCVDVTEDHSLLDEKCNKIKPTEIDVGSALYHSFPPVEDLPEIEITDAKIEGKVKLCRECGSYKLLMEFYQQDNLPCKECVFNKNHSVKERKTHNKEYVSETEYIRNPSQNLDKDLAYVWGMFMAEGSCGSYKSKTGTKNSWAINNADLEVLEKCKTILESCEPLFGWKILDTMKSSAVYKLVPCGHLAYIVKKWRRLFYDKEGYKKVPYFILNGSDDMRLSFFDGYYFGDGDKHTYNRIKQYKFDIKGKIGAHGLFVLLTSLGIKVGINTKKSKDNIYTLHTCKKYRKNPLLVKKIIQLPDSGLDDYVYDIETENGRFMGGIGNMILKNTDSCYINFPIFSRLEDSKECYDFCVNVENEMLSLFPRPMKLTYEEKIYWRFFILSKKRYMALQCKSDGKIAENIFKRGVVLNRRDNSKLLKNLYSDIIMKVFYKEGQNLILNYVNDKLTNIFQFGYKSADYVTTKSIGKVEDYKIRQLSEDEVKKNKRLEMLNCTEKEYYSMRGLPSHIQLAERMKNRGKRVEPGTRLEHIIIDNFDLDGKLFDKIESWEYFRDNSDILRIDFYYYLKSFINPLDQVIETAFGLKDFIKKIYKNHALKYKMLQQLKSKSGSKINFIN